jgi:hypothetical protein
LLYVKLSPELSILKIVSLISDTLFSCWFLLSNEDVDGSELLLTIGCWFIVGPSWACSAEQLLTWHKTTINYSVAHLFNNVCWFDCMFLYYYIFSS